MQTYNDVLKYIKINLGVPVNKLELTDDDIVDLIKTQVLPYFSQYSPYKKYTYINNINRITSISAGQPIYMYKIPIENNEYIIDIYEAYPTNVNSLINNYSNMIINSDGAINLVIANSFIDAIKSLGVRNTWEFSPPDTLIFDQEVTACVIVYNTIHSSLSTIRPDLYHIAFKQLCLANIKLWISSMRSKFENLTTPLGQLNLDWQRLQQEGQQEKEKVQQILNILPPDHLIEVSV